MSHGETRLRSGVRTVEVQIPDQVGADWNDVHQLQLNLADVGANHGWARRPRITEREVATSAGRLPQYPRRDHNRA